MPFPNRRSFILLLAETADCWHRPSMYHRVPIKTAFLQRPKTRFPASPQLAAAWADKEALLANTFVTKWTPGRSPEAPGRSGRNHPFSTWCWERMARTHSLEKSVGRHLRYELCAASGAYKKAPTKRRQLIPPSNGPHDRLRPFWSCGGNNSLIKKWSARAYPGSSNNGGKQAT